MTTFRIPGSILPGETTEQWAARVRRSGWVPACGGTEVPFDYCGRRVLYVVDLLSTEHGYVDLDTDIVWPTLDSLAGIEDVDPREGVADYEDSYEARGF
jgi:hypothetical protein